MSCQHAYTVRDALMELSDMIRSDAFVDRAEQQLGKHKSIKYVTRIKRQANGISVVFCYEPVESSVLRTYTKLEMENDF